MLRVAADLRERISQPEAFSNYLAFFAKGYGFSRKSFKDIFDRTLGLQTPNEDAIGLDQEVLEISDQIGKAVSKLPSFGEKQELLEAVDNLKLVAKKLASLQ